jgi:hypothetical protein
MRLSRALISEERMTSASTLLVSFPPSTRRRLH